ncbi:MAG: TIGR01212 family radical SAM protein [Lachnospiraceae bacterium]|nr:TIGR01212 family radical SAM protein [Lachnospiraceae bacterium]
MITANDYYRNRFGGKVYRISLNGGMSCPNRDGTLDTRGCIFCSKGGSGDFAASASLSVTEQLVQAKQKIAAKLPKNKSRFAGYIAYFQAFTNTYAPVSYLRQIFTEAVSDPEVVGLSIATRPDCLSPECVLLLSELNRIKPVYVELGLQTIHKSSAEFIRRGYPLEVYDDAVSRLQSHGILVITHVILGLPKESYADMVATVTHVVNAGVHGIKLQLLHVLKDTDLADYYRSAPASEFSCMSLDAYISVLQNLLPLIPEETVIYRLTGDGPKHSLIAPLWSGDKKNVLNTLHRQLERSFLCNPKC